MALSIKNYSSTIKALSLFNGFTESEKEALIKDGYIQNYPRDHYLFHHSDSLNFFYIICDGIVKLFRTNIDGNEKTIDILTAGNTICKIEIFERSEVHTASAVAIKDTVVMKLPKTWLTENAKKSNTFALNLLWAIAKKYSSKEIEVEQQATMSAPQLVSCFLQKLCSLHNFELRDFELPYSKALIASRLGIEVETFSRTLAKLRDNGIIVNGSHVCIKDLAAAHDYACDHCFDEENCPTHQFLVKNLLRK